LPVSFSTIEARMIASRGVATALPGRRAAHSRASSVRMAACILASTAALLSPRWKE
jgi:hypothetical protein